MRSSDQRYFQVRRTKREANLYPEIATALADAKRDPAAIPALNSLIEQSAHEFSHILLASGRTATDFRRNYRRGCARHNMVAANDIAPHASLLVERLDGYQVMRLSKEQTANIKMRWVKLRTCDLLIHDPQGVLWARIIGASLSASNEDNLGLLGYLRDRGENLVADKAVMGTQEAVDRAAKQLVRFVSSFGDNTPDWMEEWDAERQEREARFAWRRANRMIREGAEWHQMNDAEFRLEIEKQIVIAEAFLDGGNVMAAYHDPDTSKRHSRLQPRLDRLQKELAL